MSLWQDGLPPPLSFPSLVTHGGSTRPMAMLAWPDTAIDATKCDKDEEQHRIGVSSETKELGSTWPQPVVEDNGEWFKYHPHDAPQPQIGPPHLRVPKTMP